MADEFIRASVQELPVPEVEDAAFTAPPPLSEATVAIVTTAGLRRPGDPSWKPNDPSDRVFNANERNLALGHLSPNFDRSGVAADLNVAYPLDRLIEMESEGVVGKVAPHHLTFMGAQDELMNQIRNETGPQAAKELLRDGVQVVLLTPV